MRGVDAAPPTLTGAAAGQVVADRWILSVADGPDRGISLELTPGTYRVGSDRDGELVLTDPRISRQHLLLHVSNAGIHVRDLGSKNGSYLAGARFTEATLLPGSVVRIGNSRLAVTSAEAAPLVGFGQLVGSSPAMRELCALLAQAAASSSHVLVEGETGSGKELCAEALHAHGSRASGPFVVCDMAAMKSSLLESELFGHVKGAFTGADHARAGLFADAHGGTLFIDELGELSLALQPRLLRAIDRRQVKAVGSERYRPIDVRIVAATNRNLEEDVRAGRFREDLFYRLAVVRIRVPPLRERKEDIPHLARAFVGGRAVLAPDTMAVLCAYDWPGNVRELKHVLERGLARLPGGEGELSPSLLGLDGDSRHDEARDKRSFAEARDRLIQAWERGYLEQLLARAGGNVSRASREGGIDRVYLHRLLKRHGLGARGGKG